MRRGKTIIIGRKKVGPWRPVFVIAEAGVNHNGRLDLALKLVNAAAAAGADAVKFQTFKAEQVATKVGEMAEYQKKNTGRAESQVKMLKRLELPEGFYKQIINRCRKKNILFLSTPHGGFESVDFLLKLNVPALKFGSGDLNNLPLLQYAAKFKKPMLLGTGMATMKEVEEAVDAVKKEGNDKVIVLHCTTSYPCLPGEVNLSAMSAMMRKINVLIGYSDHTLSSEVPVMAATLGACVLEKHFTLDRNMKGPDHKASVEPAELENIIVSVRKVRIIMGSDIKKPTKNEIPLLKVSRKSIVAKKDIKKGEKFSTQNLAIKRPGIGLPPKLYLSLIGRVAVRNITRDSLINKSHYE